MKHKTVIKHITTFLWNVFIGGLIAILPIALTVTIFNSSIKLFVGWLEPLRRFISPIILKTVPHAEIVITIGFIFIIGTLYNHFILDRIIHSIEKLVARIPLVRLVYSGIKQLVRAFGSQDKPSFQRVVLVHFPRQGIYSIGFLTSQLSSSIAPNTETVFYTVFIPTTPNPTSGFCIIVPESELINSTLSSQEAMAMIISGGIIQPNG
jgi:uncharacterized membrane protein